MIYGYVRVSTDRQTTENQRFEIENYCRKNDIVIDEWINETVSGKTDSDDRKLGGLLKKITQNDTVVCCELSRLSRTMYTLIAVLHECERQNVKIIAIKENINSQEDKRNKYLVGIFAVLVEIERDLISQRTQEALNRLKAQGVKLGRPAGSKSKKTKLSGKEKLISDLRRENVSLRKMAKTLKINIKTLSNFIKKHKL